MRKRTSKHEFPEIRIDCHQKIRYRSNEHTALMQADGRAFVIVVQGDISAHIVAEILVRALPSIRRFVTRYPLPFIAKVTRSSKVSLWVTSYFRLESTQLMNDVYITDIEWMRIE
jgi:hypothetical protein